MIDEQGAMQNNNINEIPAQQPQENMLAGDQPQQTHSIQAININNYNDKDILGKKIKLSDERFDNMKN